MDAKIIFQYFLFALIFGCVFSASLFAQPYPYKGIGDGKPATDVILTLVDGIAVDREGNIYISHRSMNRIRKIGKDGIITTVAGNGEAGYSGDGGPGRGANLDLPSGIAVDGKGNVIFSDKMNSRLRKIDANGVISTIAGTGREGYKGNGGQAIDAALFLPDMITMDKAGNIYLISPQGRSWIVRKISAYGVITLFAGNAVQGYSGNGGPAREASFHTLKDVAVDAQGNVYLADYINQNIRKIDTGGTISTVAEENWKLIADEEIHPSGIAVDAEGNIFVSDSGSSKIRKIDTQGKVTVYAGNGQFKDFGDGGPAIAAGIRSPGAAWLFRPTATCMSRKRHRTASARSIRTGPYPWSRARGYPVSAATAARRHRPS